MDYRAYAYQAAQRAGHPDPAMFVRQIHAESGFRPNAKSPAGATGIAQIMPATAKGWGVNPNDPKASLDAAARAMAKYIKSYKGDYAKALAAYNAGVGNVAKYGGVPPFAETQNYIKKILNGKSGQAPAGSYSAPATSSGSDDRRSRLMREFMAGSSWEGFMDFMDTYGPAKPDTATASSSSSSTAGYGTQQGVPKRKPGEPGWKYLQRIGQSMFGLKNDPGNSQTTGGKHSAGSRHYAGQAIDFGDARNSKQQLQAWHDYLDANRQALGLAELIWQAPGHYNHVHAATARTSKGLKKR